PLFLHSFPTRRSSDLPPPVAARGAVESSCGHRRHHVASRPSAFIEPLFDLFEHTSACETPATPDPRIPQVTTHPTRELAVVPHRCRRARCARARAERPDARLGAP